MTFDGVMWTIICLMALLMIRLEIVAKIRMRRIADIHRFTVEIIRKNNGENWMQYWSDFDKVTFNNMLFDLTKWRYSHFYAEL